MICFDSILYKGIQFPNDKKTIVFRRRQIFDYLALIQSLKLVNVTGE